MTTARPDQPFFEPLLANVHGARGRWRKDRLAVFAARAGRQATGELMIVGRALNGGSCTASIDDIGTPAGRVDVAASAFRDAHGTTKDPMQWVLDCWGARGSLYNTRRSQFWRTARSCVQHLGLVGDVNDWPFVLTWSDLYKVSPARSGNPPASLMRAQRGACIDILAAEIRHWKPRRILFLTGKSWALPFISAIGWKLDRAASGPAELVGIVDGACRIVVAPHPQGQRGKLLVDSIVAAFQALERPSAREQTIPNRRATAYHEAAHAVADHRLGFTSTGCSIRQEGLRLGGASAYDTWDSEIRARDFLIALYAGYCAEVALGEDRSSARATANDDFERAREVRELFGDFDETASVKTAFAFVEKRENWLAIEAVASDLLEHEELDGDEVAMLVDIADGASKRELLDSYRAMSEH